MASLSEIKHEQDLKNTKIRKRNFDKPYPWYFVFLLKKMNSALLSMEQPEIQEITTILTEIKLLSNDRLPTEDGQIHFIIGLPNADFAETKILFLSHIHDLPPDCNCTLLQGYHKHLHRRKLRSRLNDFTIGDDVELMAHELTKSNSTLISSRTSLSIFQQLDDSLFEIKCKRKSNTLTALYRTFKKQWKFHVFLFLYCKSIMIFVEFISGEYIRSKNLNGYHCDVRLNETTSKRENCLRTTKLIVSYAVSHIAYWIYFIELIWLTYNFILFCYSQFYFLFSMISINPPDRSTSQYQELKLIIKTAILI